MDIEHLLRDVSADSPCGDDLEYDAAFLEMTRASAGKPAQEMGGQVIPGEEPDWKDVLARCTALFARTKDLRIAVTTTRALLHVEGFRGLADGLAVTHGLIDRQWQGVHPRLDPSDGNDPTFRMNTLAGLAARDEMVVPLRLLPLAESRRLGRFGLRDFEIANGTLPKPEGAESVADMSTIDAAFLDMDGAALQARADAAHEALATLGTLESRLAELAGAGATPDLSALKSTLKTIQLLLQQQLARRGLGSGEAVAAAADGGTTITEARPAMSGPIQSREDVIRMLDQVSDWYSKYEPSSPVPLLLQRAKRLVNKSFMEAVRDLSPSGVTEVQSIAGVEQS